jgi:hypothetical protein
MLVNLSEIQKHRPISESVNERIINQFIEDAQIADLRPLLGEKFYFSIINEPNNYADLLEEKNYEFEEVQMTSPGIKKVLSLYAYARYILNGSQTDTPFGFVTKQYQEEKQVDRAGLKESYKATQQIAAQYWGQVELYLNRNSSDYPLWRDSCTLKNRTFRLNKITR